MPADTDSWISLLQLVVSIAGVVITIWLAFIVQRGAARLTELEFARAVRDSWLHIDDVTLRDADFVHLANQYMVPYNTTDAAFPKKRLMLLMLLSPLQTTYQAAHKGLFGRDGASSIDSIKAQLAYFVKDDEAYWVSQNGGFVPAFMAICREVRAQVMAGGAGAEPSTVRDAP
jgi:hypothetical protein